MTGVDWDNSQGWLGRWVAQWTVGAVLLGLAATSPPVLAAGARQETFASPDAAVDALVAAARSDHAADLVRVLGPDSRKLVLSGDPVADKQGREKFVAAATQKHQIENPGEDKAILIIGADQWPFPIPIVQRGGKWFFDTKAGEKEILDRRIGRNELSAIEVCRAYVDAQREYASKPRNGDGIIEYAEKFLSTPGKEDGLYWEPKSGEPESPMGPLVASAHAEGYQRQPYHGYYYRILKGQGSSAPGGAYSYMAGGQHMIGGFALVAFPADYGASGIMTFIVNQDGVVHQKNLGRNTAEIVRRMTIYDPDASWATANSDAPH